MHNIRMDRHRGIALARWIAAAAARSRKSRISLFSSTFFVRSHLKIEDPFLFPIIIIALLNKLSIRIVLESNFKDFNARIGILFEWILGKFCSSFL